MKNLKEVIREIQDTISLCNADGSESQWIACEVLGVGRAKLNLIGQISESDADKMLAMAKERAKGRPLWQVVGKTNFAGCEIDVNSDVLCPRPETEELFENTLKTASKSAKILDLCTGSGCISIALAVNSQADITAVDISDKALAVAKKNAENNGVSDRIKFIKSDMFSAVQGRYDVIVSNPPYIPTKDIEGLDREVREYEPFIALDGGDDGLKFYKIIAKEAKAYLNPKGAVLLEVGIGQAEQVASLFKGYETKIIYDLQGVQRIVKAVLTDV